MLKLGRYEHIVITLDEIYSQESSYMNFIMGLMDIWGLRWVHCLTLSIFLMLVLGRICFWLQRFLMWKLKIKMCLIFNFVN